MYSEEKRVIMKMKDLGTRVAASLACVSTGDIIHMYECINTGTRYGMDRGLSCRMVQYMLLMHTAQTTLYSHLGGVREASVPGVVMV